MEEKIDVYDTVERLINGIIVYKSFVLCINSFIYYYTDLRHSLV